MKQMGVVFFSRTPESVTINFVNKQKLLRFDLFFVDSSEVKKKNTVF